ncbi:MAG: flagellar basal body-associated FliL family protein [Spirochaetales bacterium]|nr:flagellar basal body-associated FliL family protein [Spirochaetales bacterium]
MSDEKDDNLNNMDDTDGGGMESKKRGLNPFIIKILSGVAGIVLLITLVVVVCLLVVKCSTTGTGGTGTPDNGLTDIRKPHVEHPAILAMDTPFRQQLRDGKMIQVDIALAYAEKNKKLQTELTQNKAQIRDIVIKTLSKLEANYFSDVDPLSKLEDDLIKQINRMLNEGEIEGIFFQEYTLMGN